MKTSKITRFVNRLNKLGINVELTGNYPWVYLSKVNDRVIRERFMANHGFTVFFVNNGETVTDIKKIFSKIRETISPFYYIKALFKKKDVIDEYWMGN
jgi:very-short-patch-repair endonuclease